MIRFTPQHPLGRRQFLVGLGSVALSAACTKPGNNTSSASGPTTSRATTSTLARQATSSSFPPLDQRTLVVVEFAGGNDALSMVVPHANGRYHDLRPTLAITDSLDLDGEIGLHPALTELASLYGSDQLAIIEGVGTPDSDLSHFVQMQRWWDGTDDPVQTGWLGRYLDGTVGYDQMLAGISVGPGPNSALRGDASFSVSVSDAAGIGSDLPWWVEEQESFLDTWSSFAPSGVAPTDLSLLERSIQSTVASQQELASRLAPLTQQIEQGEVPEDEAQTMAGQLRIAAHLISSGLQPKVIVVHGNTEFDTHENQEPTHTRMMNDFNAGVKVFNQIVAEAGMSDRAIIMTTSEFGRRVQDNAGGTDHGAGSTHLVLGTNVAGGRYGEPHDLSNLDEDGNLRWTVNHRSIYATVLKDWLGVDPIDVLHQDHQTLAFLGS